ncbi:hypothetical protein [Streptomyces europaeiscabiei]|uniref:hypothetical protein n=1 Tax=Streptomyces europaeiscabiei TaxID=146819 RepID=UPI002E27C51F|nr:hypothetical protein [Streptomyces europaeiscabiei]
MLVVFCALAFFAWQRLGSPLSVSTVTTARPTVQGCDGTRPLTWGFIMERVTRIELALSAWEATALGWLYGC